MKRELIYLQAVGVIVKGFSWTVVICFLSDGLADSIVDGLYRDLKDKSPAEAF